MTTHLINNAQEIAIFKGDFILMPESTHTIDGDMASTITPIIGSFQAEVMQLGYMFDYELCDAICHLSKAEIVELHSMVIPILRTLKGADKRMKPLYPNFPSQVMKAEAFELFSNAILHYWSCGQWRPEYKKQRRLPKFEDTKFLSLRAGTESDCMAIFTKLLASNASISAMDHEVIRWFVEAYGEDLVGHIPEQIPFKEQAASFAAQCIKHHYNMGDRWIKTATDVLRVVTGISGGDLSLAENTQFASLSRPVRRHLIQLLEKGVNPDDISRHGEKWKRVFHSLHIGDYQKIAPKSYHIADKLRNGKIVSFRSQVEQYLESADYNEAIQLLLTRPGELARRLDHLLRTIEDEAGKKLIDDFGNNIAAIDTRLLFQLLGHFRNRDKARPKRLVFPKGQQTRARILNRELPALPASHVRGIIELLEGHLRDRFSDLEVFGKVWIDPSLMNCPIPLSQRSASPGLLNVARGTRLPLSEKSTLRLFIWWIGEDVDLSAVLYSDQFEKRGHISYTNLREKAISSCHSGDIVKAPGPDGAAEFIDINIDEALAAGCRYVLMSVLDYTGITFARYEDCCAGWMTRDYPDANEIYDPKTVDQKIDIRTASRCAIPVVFDLKERCAIWLDLQSKAASQRFNNVESNAATLEQIVESTLLLDNKPTLHNLFRLHAVARGTIVENRDEADMVFAIDEGVTPFDIDEILSGYLS